MSEAICYRCDYRPVVAGKKLCKRCLVGREQLRGRPRVPCRHQCGRTVTPIRAQTHRGLCWTCFTTAEIRGLYPPRQARHEDHYHDLALPAEPTDAQPGSEAKIEVLCQRASRGERLWHPLDVGRPGRGLLLAGCEDSE